MTHFGNLKSQGTGGEHVIQSVNWRGAQDPARELELGGGGGGGGGHVMQVTH